MLNKLKSLIAQKGSLAAAAGMGSGAGSIEEAAPSYNPTYPYNTVLIESESGHLIEVDDTPDAARVHIHHRSGTHIEMRPDGGVKYKTVKTRQDVTIGDHEIMISGDWNITVEGGYNLHIKNGELIIDAKDDAAINVKGKLKMSAENIELNAKNKIFLNAPKVDIGGISPGGKPMMSLPGKVTINEKWPLDPTFVPKVTLPLSPAGKSKLSAKISQPDTRFNSVNPIISQAGITIGKITEDVALGETLEDAASWSGAQSAKDALKLLTKGLTALNNAVRTQTPSLTPAMLDAAVAQALKEDMIDASGEPAFSKLAEQPGELPLSNPTLYKSAQVLGPGQITGPASTIAEYQKIRGRAFDTPEDVSNMESYTAHINLSIELGDFTKEYKQSAGRVVRTDTKAPDKEPIPSQSFPLPSGGTTRVTTGSRVLQGTGTTYNEDLSVGDTVEFNGVKAVIASADEETTALLTEPWSGETSSGALRVYRLRPMKEFFGKFTYTDADSLGNSGLQLRDLLVNFTSPVIEVPQINAAMLTSETASAGAVTTSAVTSGTGTSGVEGLAPTLVDPATVTSNYVAPQ